MDIALRIRHARRRTGLSQTALAELVGVKRSAVSNWEAVNSVHPSMCNMIAIAQSTGVSMEWLATGRGDVDLSNAAATDVPVAEAELVELIDERALLRLYRTMSPRSQTLMMDLATALAPKLRAKHKANL